MRVRACFVLHYLPLIYEVRRASHTIRARARFNQRSNSEIRIQKLHFATVLLLLTMVGTSGVLRCLSLTCDLYLRLS